MDAWEKDMLWEYEDGGSRLVIPAWMKSMDDQDVAPNHELDLDLDLDEDDHQEDSGGHACDEPSHYIQKVDKICPSDNYFRQELTFYPSLQYGKYPIHDVTTLVKDVVVRILCRKSTLWNELREKSLVADDYELYCGTIRQAACLVSTFYNKESLFRRGHLRTSYEQMDVLYEEVVAKGGTACSLYEVGKLIAQLDYNKYSFVTEDGLATMLSYYPRKIPAVVDEGYAPTPSEKQVFDDITKVVREMTLCFFMGKDEHSRLLKIFLKEKSQEKIGELLNAAMRKVRPDAVDLMDKDHIFVCISSVLGCVISDMRLMLQDQLSTLLGPLFDLYNPSLLNISLEVLDIVDVAQIRRMALGSRFVCRSHLIWAFYELGYAFPFHIRDHTSICPFDDDYPPYHIYVAAMKLADYCGGRCMKLEHFVYVVFSWNGIGFEETPLDKMVDAFNDFIVVLGQTQTYCCSQE